ncbi:MAG TPA: hypothetical protein VG408_07880 [Actinomycetota bacterium]|nr:hypothetical protein [Actinomycetota bacterium]
MISRALKRSISLSVAAIAILGVVSAQSTSAQGDGSGGRAVAHHAGGEKIDDPSITGRAPEAHLLRTGMKALEPTLGISKDGIIYFVATPGLGAEILRSVDGGRRWETVSPRLGDRNAHPVTLDPYVYLDKWTGRLFTIDLTVACSYLSYTDDLEVGWTTNPLACGRPVNDHQTLFSGPPVSSTPIGYDNIVYYCWNDVATSSCSKSLDGGLTFTVTGSPAYLGPNTEKTENCGGLHGHGVVGEDGTIFLPREYCEQPWLAISRDEGLTWEHVRVSNKTAIWGPDPSVDVDEKGNVYYVYLDKDRLPYLVVSRDNGKTWSKPKMIASPGLTETVHATIDAGDPGSVAVAYYGTDDVKGPIEEREYSQEVEWSAYITMTTDAFSNDPVFYTGQVNASDDPMARGPCGPRRCYDALDFIDVVIAPNGIPYAALADSCFGPCVGPGAPVQTSGVVGALVGGPRLR